jgi:hypothetical protein
MVASQGFEPRYAESESAVLPLNEEATGVHPVTEMRSGEADAAGSRRSARPIGHLHIIRGMVAAGQSRPI